MRNIYLLIICIFTCTAAEPAIIETNDLEHLFTHDEEGTLYVFDLDNTLIETPHHLGSDQWFSYRVESLIKTGVKAQDALEQSIACWVELHKKIEMKLVDPSIPSRMNDLTKKQIHSIGLTKRTPSLATRTIDQLRALTIDFHPPIDVKNALVFDGMNGTLYQGGVIFVADKVEKGPALVAYVGKMKKKPSKIVFIDDKMSHVKNIVDAIEVLKIPILGIRYGGLDEKIKQFNPKVADLQLQHFQQVLSDEQALHLLQMKENS